MTPAASIETIAKDRSRLALGIATAVVGLALFIAAGFAAPSFLHNSTHDTRHALGLPCH